MSTPSKHPGIDISLEGVKTREGVYTAKAASRIDIPLRGKPQKRRLGAGHIRDTELEFVNRHHAAVKKDRTGR